MRRLPLSVRDATKSAAYPPSAAAPSLVYPVSQERAAMDQAAALKSSCQDIHEGAALSIRGLQGRAAKLSTSCEIQIPLGISAAFRYNPPNKSGPQVAASMLCIPSPVTPCNRQGFAGGLFGIFQLLSQLRRSARHQSHSEFSMGKRSKHRCNRWNQGTFSNHSATLPFPS